MEHRPLGRTGVSVSKLCLGTMMFGDWGNTDHDETHPDHPPGAGRRDQLHRHRRRLLRWASPRRSSARRWPAGGATRSCWRPRCTARWARTRTAGASRGAGSSARSRTRCAGSAPTGSTSTRSTATTPTTDIEETLGALTDLVRQGKVRYLGSSTFPPSAIVEAQWAAQRPAPASGSSASSRRTRSSSGASRPTCCRPAQRYGMGGDPLESAGRRLAVGPLPQGRRPEGRSRPPGGGWPSASTCRCPPNQRKLEAAEQLGRAGRGGRDVVDRAGHRVRAQPPGGHRGDHRAAHHGAAGKPARRRGRRPGRGDCWTASTRSFRPASTSTPPTAGGPTRPCSRPHDGARRTGAAEAGPLRTCWMKETHP